MKNLAISTAFLIFSIKAFAVPSFPRDVNCIPASDLNIQSVTLASNNTFWAENDNHRVQLKVVDKNGAVEVYDVSSTDSTFTRGTGEGLKNYHFSSSQGKSAKVVFENKNDFRGNDSIVSFTAVLQDSGIVIDSTSDTCEMRFYPKTEI